MYGLQHGALAHTEQQAIKGPKITSVKPFICRTFTNLVNNVGTNMLKGKSTAAILRYVDKVCFSYSGFLNLLMPIVMMINTLI